MKSFNTENLVKINASNLGWVVAAGLACFMVGSGFQSPTLKIGIADVDKVMSGSDYWKTNEASFNTFTKERGDLLIYVKQNAMMSSDEAAKVKELSLLDNPTAQQKAELDRLKADITDEQKRKDELSIKASLTPEERTLLSTYATREQTNTNQTLPEWDQQFTQEIQQKRTDILTAATDKAKTAVQSVGRAQGYTIIFSAAAAPYAANDITDDALKSMNAQK